jgi:hypothetical protein
MRRGRSVVDVAQQHRRLHEAEGSCENGCSATKDQLGLSLNLERATEASLSTKTGTSTRVTGLLVVLFSPHFLLDTAAFN